MNRSSTLAIRWLLPTVLLFLVANRLWAADPGSSFDRKKVVAWCIVPFDSQKRDPAQRAAMVEKLGLRRVAYDWRAEHVPQFEAEILEYQKHGLEFFAFWSVHEEAFKLFEKYQLKPQVWMIAPSPPATLSQEERVAEAAQKLLPVVERTRNLGCPLGLYNHGNWSGEPENLVAICEYLRRHHQASHVGIVYNQHHGHDHVERFATALAAMKPYLLCLNLNGMEPEGDKHGKKIQPLGQGELDVQLLKIIAASGYGGPIGIIGHTMDDVELRLMDNLEGLDWMVQQLEGKAAAPKPVPRLPLQPAANGKKAK
jgi:hypothetical protein